MTPAGYAEPHDPRFVYTFWNAADECLYVGCTVDFPRRLRTHQLERGWWPEVARIDITVHSDQEAGFTAETARIRELNPRHNRIYTDHPTPTRRPCRKCRSSSHDACLGFANDGQPCRCSVCARMAVA